MSDTRPRIVVYLPGDAAKRDVKVAAAKAGKTVSDWVWDQIEPACSTEQGTDRKET